MPYGVSCRQKRYFFNTPKRSQISRSYHLMAARLRTTIWRVREHMRRSSICFSTMPAMSRSIPNSRLISESRSHRCWRFGARTIHFLYLPEPKHSGGIILKRRSTSTQLVISLWKLIVKKLRLLFAISSIELLVRLLQRIAVRSVAGVRDFKYKSEVFMRAIVIDGFGGVEPLEFLYDDRFEWLELKEPALFTRTPTEPKGFSVSSNNLFTSAALETSAWSVIALPPLLVICRTVRSVHSLSAEQFTATAAPTSANPLAIAAPMPLDAPVTIATLLVNLFISNSFPAPIQ